MIEALTKDGSPLEFQENFILQSLNDRFPCIKSPKLRSFELIQQTQFDFKSRALNRNHHNYALNHKLRTTFGKRISTTFHFFTNYVMIVKTCGVKTKKKT